MSLSDLPLFRPYPDVSYGDLSASHNGHLRFCLKHRWPFSMETSRPRPPPVLSAHRSEPRQSTVNSEFGYCHRSLSFLMAVLFNSWNISVPVKYWRMSQNFRNSKNIIHIPKAYSFVPRWIANVSPESRKVKETTHLPCVGKKVKIPKIPNANQNHLDFILPVSSFPYWVHSSSSRRQFSSSPVSLCSHIVCTLCNTVLSMLPQTRTDSLVWEDTINGIHLLFRMTSGSTMIAWLLLVLQLLKSDCLYLSLRSDHLDLRSIAYRLAHRNILTYICYLNSIHLCRDTTINVSLS